MLSFYLPSWSAMFRRTPKTTVITEPIRVITGSARYIYLALSDNLAGPNLRSKKYNMCIVFLDAITTAPPAACRRR